MDNVFPYKLGKFKIMLMKIETIQFAKVIRNPQCTE